jgi:hypothetical protein
VTIEQTAERFRLFAKEVGHLPVYSRISTAAADDVTMLELMEEAPLGQRRLNLLLAAVHDLLLDGVVHPLGSWYPTVNGGVAPPADDPYPAFASLVDEQHEGIVDALRNRATQTNEPNRSCLWRLALPAVAATVDARVSLVELGASAGLNLCFDRYTYDFSPDGSASDALLRCAVRTGEVDTDAPVPPIVDRVGLDLTPNSVDDPRAVRWLKACIWPEQLDRHRRFDAAIAIAQESPPRLVAGDLVDDLPSVVATLAQDTHLVVCNSWVLAYVERGRREELEETLGRLAAARPVTWLSAEAPTVVSWAGTRDDYDAEPYSYVSMARWRGGVETRGGLARCHAHLEWIDWLGIDGVNQRPT